MRKLQQGDVVLRRIEAIPGNAKVILTLYGEDGKEPHYVRLASMTTLTHEEHKPIDIPTGDYEVIRVREVDPFAEEIRRVAD